MGKYMLEWMAPALFALLMSNTIRFHSLGPMPTMARTVGNLMTVAAAAFLVLMALGRRLVVSRQVVILLLAMAASATVSVLGSGGVDHSLQRLELYVVVVFLATAVYLAYRDSTEPPLVAYFLAIAGVHIPFSIAAVLWIRDLEPPFWTEGYRVAHFANVRQYAEFAYFAAACGTGLCLLSRRLLVPSFLLAAVGMFGIILTGSRGAALSWVIFVVLACCFTRTRLRAAIHGVLVAVSTAGLVLYLDHSGALKSPNIFSRIVSIQRGEEGFDNTRLDLWRMSLRQVMAHPLFGSGPEGYWLSGCCNIQFMQAHNFVLQFLIEFGLVGCVLVLLLALHSIKAFGGARAASRLVLATQGNRVLACLLASFLGYSMIDQTMYHLVPLLLFGMLAGLFAAGLVQARDSANSGGS